MTDSEVKSVITYLRLRKHRSRLHKRKLHVFGEVLFHRKQLPEDQKAQSPLTRSDFHDIYRFGLVALRRLEPVVYELENHVCVALRELRRVAG